MKINQKEKYEIIRLVEQSEKSARETLKEIGVPKSTFFDWYSRYLKNGFDGLANAKRKPKQVLLLESMNTLNKKIIYLKKTTLT